MRDRIFILCYSIYIYYSMQDSYVREDSTISRTEIIDIIIYNIGHRKDIDLYLKPIRGNNNIINLYTSYEKNVQLSPNKYLLLLL